jgi:phage terminase large subunit-like protein
MADTHIPLFAYNPGRADKTSRAHAVSYIPCNGHMWVPESEINRGKPRDWVEPFLHQLCVYPNTKHDEYVDCLSQALAFLRDQAWFIEQKDDDEQYIDNDHKVWYNKETNYYLR